MKCYLHIGTEKTGTTSIQEWLYKNKKELGKNRIYCSSILGSPNNRKLVSYFQKNLNDDWFQNKKISNVDDKNQHFNGFLDDFKQEIINASKSNDIFIITSEHFHSRLITKEEVEELYEFLSEVFTEIKIICYFRNQFDLAVSLYSTGLRQNVTLKIDDYITKSIQRRHYYNYFEFAEKWSDYFGADNCIFKIYGSDYFVDKDLCKDFLNIINPKIDLNMLSNSKVNNNMALYALQAEAYRLINLEIPRRNYDGTLNKQNVRAKKRIDAIPEFKMGKIDCDKRNEVLQYFKKSNEKFFKKYFDYENLFV